MERPSWTSESTDIDRPSPARMYDYALGGAHNLAADRELVTELMQLVPDALAHARSTGAFQRRVVSFCTDAGVRQFLNLGSGILTRGSAHEVAQRAAPEARVMYVDTDPIPVGRSHAILIGNDRTGAIQADLRQPEHILAHRDVRSLLDFDQPIAVLADTLHFVPQDPAGIVAAFRDAVVPGSYLMISHPTAETRPEEMAKSMQMVQRGGLTVTPRSRAEVERLFAGFELVEPGLVWVHEWRPDLPHGPASDLDRPFMLGGVGRKV